MGRMVMRARAMLRSALEALPMININWIRVRLASIVLGMLALGAACAGQSCACIRPIPGNFQPDKRIANAVQTRVGTQGISFLQSHAAQLGGLLPGGLDQHLPADRTGGLTCGIPADQGDPMCTAHVNLSGLTLTPQASPAGRVNYIINAIVRTQSSCATAMGCGPGLSSPAIPINISGTYCLLVIDTTRVGPPALDITGMLTFTPNATTDLTSVNFQVSSVSNIQADDLALSGLRAADVAQCNTLDTDGFTRGALATIFLPPQLRSQVETSVNQLLCQSCTTDADCTFGSTLNVCFGASSGMPGVCKPPGATMTTACLQKTGLEGRIDAGALLAALSPGIHADLDLYNVIGHYANTQMGGISLGVSGGLEPVTRSPCVPAASPPPFSNPVPFSAAFDGPTLPINPVTGQEFHLGIGVAKDFLNHGGWAAWQSGALCLDLTRNATDLLNSGSFVPLAMSLADLVHLPPGTSAPMLITVRPQQAPEITLGKNTVANPLVSITARGFQLNNFVLTDNRYVLVATLTADVTLPIVIDVDGQGRLVPMLGTAPPAQNPVVTNSSLLSETPAQLATTLPALLAVALPELARGLFSPAALPALLGIKLKLAAGSLTSDSSLTASDGSFLEIFTDLDFAAPAGAAGLTATAELLDLQVPPPPELKVSGGIDYQRDTPRVRVRVGAVGVDPAKVEWLYRLDHGFASPFQDRSELEIQAPILLFQGHHDLAVQTRLKGRPETLSEPLHLPLLIDTVAPAVSLERRGAFVEVTAHDTVTPDEKLELAYSLDHKPFVALSAAKLRLPADFGGSLVVRATDEAKNSAYADLNGNHGRSFSTGCSCSVSGERSSSTAGGALLLGIAMGLVMLLHVGLKRRGSSAVWIGLLFVAAISLVGCSSSNPAKPVTLGQVGRGSDLAARSGKVMVSAYNFDDAKQVGNLVLGVRGSNGALKYSLVDGNAMNDVGLYSSIRLDTMGRARIAYYDLTNHALKLAVAKDTSNASFTLITIDKPPSGATTSAVGLFNSLVLSSSGAPQIAYMASGLPDPSGGFTSMLKVARSSTATPGAASDFTLDTVDTAPVSCFRLCSGNSACDLASGKCLSTACSATCANTGRTCVQPAPRPSAPTPTPTCVPNISDLPEGVGLFASLIRLSNDDLDVAYYDNNQGNLVLGRRTGGAWATKILDGIDTMGMKTADVGQWASAAVGTGDTVHIVYQDATNERLKYLQVMGSTAQAPEIADNGLRDDGPHLGIGNDARIAIDASGSPRVVYQDGQAKVMQVAQRTGPNSWQRSGAPGALGGPNRGFFTRIAVDGSSIWVSDFFYDRSAMPFGQLEIGSL